MSRLPSAFVPLAIGLTLGCWPLAAEENPPKPTETNDSFSAEDVEFFEKEVRPILANRCYECHGPDTKEPKGGLRVDSRTALIEGGDTGPAIVPGDSKKSLLIDSVNYGETYQMPPKSRLPVAEVVVLMKWVEKGAPWPRTTADASTKGSSKAAAVDVLARKETHWCWKPVRNNSPPAVRDSAWPRQEWDRFILAKLEDRRLAPAPRADRRTLIRRLSFDLLGLPPTAERVAAFVADDSPQAYEKLVDELLKSPQFGERWARHWMDLVRYGETCGHEFDYPIHQAWRYRDYLIRAFNQDLPYDQFVLEHLAGDLLERPRIDPATGLNESVTATGFWWLHEAIHAPVDVRGDEAGRIDNQIDVFSKTFLGLTVSCARCHDHKFDAISTRDYYALAGYLRSSRRELAMLDPTGQIHAAATQTAHDRHATNEAYRAWLANQTISPDSLAKYLLATREVVAGTPGEGEMGAAAGHRRTIDAVAKQFQLAPNGLANWVAALTLSSDHPFAAWTQLALRDAPLTWNEVAWQAWRDAQRTKRQTRRETLDAYLPLADFDDPTANGWTSTGEAFGARAAPGDWNPLEPGFRVTESGQFHSGLSSPKFQGVLRSPSFTIQHRNLYYRLAGKGCEIRLIIDGYTMIEFQQLLFGGCKFPVNTDGKWTWHRQAGDLAMYIGHRAHIEVIDHGEGWAAIDQVLSSDRDVPPPDVPRFDAPFVEGDAPVEIDGLPALASRLADAWSKTRNRLAAGKGTPADASWVNWMLAARVLADPASGDELPAELAAQVADARRRLDEAVRNLPTPIPVTAMTDGNGENERVFIRGNPRILGEESPRQLPVALVGPQKPRPPEAGSGRLDMARQVADPSNPLTSRVMVNRLWHHLFGVGLVPTVDNFGVLGEVPTHPELLDHLANQFVTEGWSVKRMIRSLVLSSTYQMSSQATPAAEEADPLNQLWHRTHLRRLEGEAVRDAILVISGRWDPQMYGPGVSVHITPFMQGRGKPGGSGPLDGAGRRSIYTEVRRNFLPPMMLAFDTPIPFSTVGRRNTSNVPAQALILMNDPFVVEQAQAWAKRLLARSSQSFEERVRDAYLGAIARTPTADELTEVRAFFATQGGERGVSADQVLASEPVWADFCHVLLNLKEFVYLE